MPDFTDLPRPTRTRRLSIVAVWNPVEDELRCEHPACGWRDFDYEEVVLCPVCGRWICEKCFAGGGALAGEVDYSTLSTRPYCDDCSKLTNDERQAVMELREKLGGAM